MKGSIHVRGVVNYSGLGSVVTMNSLNFVYTLVGEGECCSNQLSAGCDW